MIRVLYRNRSDYVRDFVLRILVLLWSILIYHSQSSTSTEVTLKRVSEQVSKEGRPKSYLLGPTLQVSFGKTKQKKITYKKSMNDKLLCFSSTKFPVRL